ncbi:hypothetical protein BGW80DRAFT_1248676 [Lactifluus volemus]|nr:hypothetical protein BGW80DRAFT_1248676 [Lactifluus volemus]
MTTGRKRPRNSAPKGSAHSVGKKPRPSPSDTPESSKRCTCTQCKSRKVKCVYKDDSSECQKCISSGLEGTCTSSAGVLTPGPDTSIPQRPLRSSRRSASSHHPPKASEDTHQPTKRQSNDRIRKSPSEGRDHYVLPTIAEEPISNASDPIISFQSFIDLEKAQPQAPSDDDDDDLDDLGLASDDDNGSIQSGSETDGDSVLEPISRQSDSAPRRSKSGGKHPTAHHSRSDSQAPQDPTDDPRTCKFDISAVVTKDDGSNCPFTIISFTSLKRLTDTVSQKLGCYPGSLKLRYRLDTDKPKTPATSIQSVDELKIFKDRLRLLIVPQRLSNGKLSSRVLKPVTVCFENGSNTDQSSAHTSQSNSRHSTTSGEKQCHWQKARPSSKQPSALGAGTGTSSNSNPVSNHTQMSQKAVVADLQQHWKCLLHSKTKDTFCWQSPQSNRVCYELTFTHLGLWAMEIGRGNATVDDKPENLHLHIARPHARAGSTPPQHHPDHGNAPIAPNAATTTGMGYQAGPTPAPQAVAAVLPQAPGPYGGPYMTQPMIGQYFMPYPGYPQLPIINPSMPFPQSPAPRAEKNPRDYPNICTWFRYLDKHEGRNMDGITFEPFGPLLAAQGFVRITQLVSEHVGLNDLQQWLSIGPGTAVLIKEYAQADVRAIEMGRLFIG